MYDLPCLKIGNDTSGGLRCQGKESWAELRLTGGKLRGNTMPMETRHSVVFESAARMAALEDDAIDLIVTSPPYPMIQMWDTIFAHQNPEIATRLAAGDGPGAYCAMHETLDGVWQECARVLRPGGFLCINIGDATRKIGTSFRLYTNHSRIIRACQVTGLQSLPSILWRKQTNAPNKFMGSGMLPAGAYVTLEHEYILIFRNGDNRRFAPEDRARRRASAFFWEERNRWFTDLWELKGVRQQYAHPTAATSSSAVASTSAPRGSAVDTSSVRSRSAAFPFELAFRLINMYSLQGDTVLDPFLGTGTTTAAAMAAARSSVGFEIDGRFAATIDATIVESLPVINERQRARLSDHRSFISTRQNAGGSVPGYQNGPHQTPVITKQETDLKLLAAEYVERTGEGDYRVSHSLLDEYSRPPRAFGFEGIHGAGPTRWRRSV